MCFPVHMPGCHSVLFNRTALFSNYSSLLEIIVLFCCCIPHVGGIKHCNRQCVCMYVAHIGLSSIVHYLLLDFAAIWSRNASPSKIQQKCPKRYDKCCLIFGMDQKRTKRGLAQEFPVWLSTICAALCGTAYMENSLKIPDLAGTKF